jgi:hypothetical protein
MGVKVPVVAGLGAAGEGIAGVVGAERWAVSTIVGPLFSLELEIFYAEVF